MRGGGDRRSIDVDPTVRVEPVGLGLMCDYNRGGGGGGGMSRARRRRQTLNRRGPYCSNGVLSDWVSCYEIFIYSVGQGERVRAQRRRQMLNR